VGLISSSRSFRETVKLYAAAYLAMVPSAILYGGLLAGGHADKRWLIFCVIAAFVPARIVWAIFEKALERKRIALTPQSEISISFGTYTFSQPVPVISAMMEFGQGVGVVARVTLGGGVRSSRLTPQATQYSVPVGSVAACEQAA